MRELLLQEYATTSAVPLAPAEIDALRTIARVDVTPSASAAGRFDLRPQSTVGAFSVGDLLVVIRPKLPVRNVLFLLGHALDRAAWREDDVDLASEPRLVEAIAAGFAAQTRRALRRGVLQGYRPVDEAATTVRGRIRFDDQIRDRHGVAPPVEVRYDEFTEDIEQNRVLRAAIHRLLRMRLRQDGTRRALRAHEGALDRVRLVEFDPRRLPTFRYTRLDAHCRPAVELALQILRGAAAELGTGGVRTSGFVVDMNQVFENFVVRALRVALGVGESEFPQNANGRWMHFDEAASVRLEPDLSWWRGGRCAWVGDVKYKDASPGGARAGDLYQIHAYCTAAGLRHGMLIYAGTGGDLTRRHRVVGSGVELEVVAVDLAVEPGAILAQIAALAAHLADRCGGGAPSASGA